MAYNIDSIEILKQDNFTITDEAFTALNVDGPELWADCDEAQEVRDYVSRNIFPWSGEGSGRGLDDLIEDVLPRFTGSADLLLTWEGGDSHSGIRVVDGVVTKHVVEMALGDEE